MLMLTTTETWYAYWTNVVTTIYVSLRRSCNSRQHPSLSWGTDWLTRAWNAFIFSKLFYCSTVWSSTSKKNIRKLQLVQNYACRIVAGLRKYDHVSEALKSLEWLNVRDKLLFTDLVMVYKYLKNLTPGYLHRHFQYCAKTQQRVTRQSNDLT